MTSEDQIQAAITHSRQMVNNVLGVPGHRPQDHLPDWVMELFDRFTTPTTPRCAHIARRPMQPWFLTVWEGTWRCRRCAVMASRVHLSQIEEGTCDLCRRYVRPERLTPTVLRSDIWILTLATCPACVRRIQDAGGIMAGGAA